MDTANRFGMTQFQERLTFQRGLEGELTRSIQALGSVQSARVHLALPNQNGFFRDQQKPSASVLLTLNRWSHAGPQPAGGHHPPGVVQRTGDGPEVGQCA
jgi:flagellar biosynthesis/type III secretory pathway M-ring protein FliF/YscJ